MDPSPRTHGSDTKSVPLPSPPHGPARPQRCPLALRRPSLIYPFMTSLMSTSLGAELAMPQAAAQLPKEGPIYLTPLQDLHPIHYNLKTLYTRGVPPGGEDDGRKEGQEKLANGQ